MKCRYLTQEAEYFLLPFGLSYDLHHDFLCSNLYRQICANSEENNPDECYWDDPTSYGFEGKCTFCCSGDNCNDDLPTNLLPHGQADGGFIPS